MSPELLVARLESNAALVRSAAVSIGTKEVRWRPRPAAWCALEVLRHLLDEEREDFRVRIEYTLLRSGESWPGIDPEGWVRTRGYLDDDYTETLDAWAAERRASVAWLRGLVAPDWNLDFVHLSLGSLRAGDLLAAWVAHDLLHVRQLLALQWGLVGRDATPYHTGYAGSWE